MRTCWLTHYAACQIDVEGCELDVLRGVHDEHWPRIQQVTLGYTVSAPKPGMTYDVCVAMCGGPCGRSRWRPMTWGAG